MSYFPVRRLPCTQGQTEANGVSTRWGAQSVALPVNLTGRRQIVATLANGHGGCVVGGGDAAMLHSQSLRVLIADDNRDAADSLAILVRLWGHDCRVAYDGSTAINVALDFLPHVVMLDFQMPGMHGGEVAWRLRQLPAFQQAKFYATSANEPDDPRLTVWRHLFDAHYVKPYNLTQLEELLANQIRCEF